MALPDLHNSLFATYAIFSSEPKVTPPEIALASARQCDIVCLSCLSRHPPRQLFGDRISLRRVTNRYPGNTLAPEGAGERAKGEVYEEGTGRSDGFFGDGLGSECAGRCAGPDECRGGFQRQFGITSDAVYDCG